MIVGMGVDIVAVDRIESAIKRNPRFLQRNFTEPEIAHAQRKEGLDFASLAGMWAAKEAYAKATGRGFRGFGFLDITVLHTEGGAPLLQLTEAARAHQSGEYIHLSISHERTAAVAICIMEASERKG